MKTRLPKYALLALLVDICLFVNGASGQDSPLGIWHGKSMCTTGAVSCRDEQVVYNIEAIPDKPDAVLIRADKIVAGKAVMMGSGPWKYNRTKRTLSWESDQRLWLLNINGKRIEGTLTESNGVVFRRMTLTKDD